MKFAVPLASAAVLAMAVPSFAVAQEAAAPAPPVAEEEADEEDQNRVTCKTFKVTGSRLAKRKVCRTQAEWKKHQEDTRASAAQALARHAAAAGNE